MIKFYFIRHGETYFNQFGRMQGWSDTPLTKKGVDNVSLIGDQLKEVDFKYIITSDLRRTLVTRDVLIQSGILSKDTIQIVEPKIRETFFGSLEGEVSEKVYQGVAEKNNIMSNEVFTLLTLEELSNSIASLDPSGLAETHDACNKRLVGWINDFVQQDKPEPINVCVITHGNVIRNIVHYIDPSLHVTRNIANSSIAIITYDDKDEFIVERFD